MRQAYRYWAMATGVLLVISAFCPVMEKNGIAVHTFRSDLGLRAGFLLLPAGLGLAVLAWVPAVWARKVGLGLSALALLVGLNYWWQGRHLDAVAWGTYFLVLVGGMALVVWAWTISLARSRDQVG